MDDDYARSLRTALVQSRCFSQIRMRALEELLLAGSSAGVEFLVLKGAALCHLVYPEPALRPMKDLDLLVAPTQLKRATDLLIDLGYEQTARAATRSVKHVPVFTRIENGFTHAVELHYDLFDGFWNRSHTWDDLAPERLAFRVGAATAHCLAPLHLMWHTWCHLMEEERLRLIWIADLFGCAETYVHELDFEGMRRQYPGLVTLLEILAPAIPISDRLKEKLRPGSYFPQGPADLQLAGWPRTKLSDWPGRAPAFIYRTFWPSRGWLAIRYGEKRVSDRMWNRTARHPLQLLNWLILRTQLRIGRNRSTTHRPVPSD